MSSYTIERPWVKKREPSHASRTHSAIYQTREWKADRLAHLTANPICKGKDSTCEKDGIVVPATVSDHIIPVERGGAMWEWSNRQPLCASCHNKKSARERYEIKI